MKDYSKLKKAFANDPEMLRQLREQEQAELLKELLSKESKNEVVFPGIEMIKGEKGDQGIQGEKGDKGDIGITGEKGKDGVDGKNGTDGKNGKNGINGTDGKDGKNGKDGVNGKDGKDGTNPDTQDVIDEIKKKKLLDISDIKNWQSAKKGKGSGGFDMNDQRWHGGGSGSGGSSDYTPQGVTTATVGGITVGTNLGTTAVTVQSILDAMLYPPVGATITLASSVAGGLREIGNIAALTAVTFTATTNDGTNPITLVDFYQGAGVIYSVPAPNPTGGVEANPNPVTITTNTSFTAKVGDGILPNVTSNTISYTFVFPMYYGVASPGLNVSADGGGLTKLVQGNTATLPLVFSPTNQVYYLVYDASYPVLTSILDDNGFETIADWTVTTGNVTNSFGVIVSCRKYEFNNLTTQVSFTNTFIQ